MTAFRDREAADRRRKGAALRALRTRLGITQAAAAEAAGFSSYKAWQNYEAGARAFSDPKLTRLLAALGASQEMFELELARLPDDAAADASPRGMAQPARAFAQAYRLPSGGVAAGGALQADRSDEAAEIIDLARYFAAGTRVLRLAGMAMYPYAESGGFVTYNPHLPPRRGQGCVIEMTDGSKLVKRYEGHDDQTLTVTELSPVERTLTIPLADVVGIYAIGLRGD